MVILFSVSCDSTFIESEIAKTKLDKVKLEEIVTSRSDFNSFLTLHSLNRQVISQLSESASAELQKYFIGIENGDFNYLSVSQKFLDNIGFHRNAQKDYELTLAFLDSKYSFNEEDLLQIIEEQLHRKGISESQKVQVITCDTYCTLAAARQYPVLEGGSDLDNLYREMQRAIYYAGCMDGCGHGG